MAKKRGNIRIESTVVDGVLKLRAVYMGPGGKQTMKRGSFPLADRQTGKRAAEAWLEALHPRIRLPEGAS